jgi:hypothetical protein
MTSSFVLEDATWISVIRGKPSANGNLDLKAVIQKLDAQYTFSSAELSQRLINIASTLNDILSQKTLGRRYEILTYAFSYVHV